MKDKEIEYYEMEYFFWCHLRDGDEHLKNVGWADGRLKFLTALPFDYIVTEPASSQILTALYRRSTLNMVSNLKRHIIHMLHKMPRYGF